MKILVLCYEYPPIGGGGGRVAQGLAEKLVERGHQVRVITAGLGWKSKWQSLYGVDVYRAGSGRRRPDACTVPEMALYLLTGFLPALFQSLLWKPDVIHAHFAMPTGVLAWAVGTLTRRPYVITAHLGDVPGGVPEQTDSLFRLVGPLARCVWRSAAGATAVSSFVRDLAVQAYRRPVALIRNGVDLTDASPPPTRVQRERHFVFLGRFNAQKNPGFLLPVFAALRELPWRLTMIGDGPLMPEFRAALQQQEMEDRVHCTGWLHATEVDDILRQADVLCMPSLSEGMPVAAVEALRRGLAIVASDIPGVRDVVKDGANGYLAPVGDQKAFIEKLRILCTNDQTLLAMRCDSCEKARDFEISSIVSQYEGELEKASRPL